MESVYLTPKSEQVSKKFWWCSDHVVFSWEKKLLTNTMKYGVKLKKSWKEKSR